MGGWGKGRIAKLPNCQIRIEMWAVGLFYSRGIVSRDRRQRGNGEDVIRAQAMQMSPSHFAAVSSKSPRSEMRISERMGRVLVNTRIALEQLRRNVA